MQRPASSSWTWGRNGHEESKSIPILTSTQKFRFLFTKDIFGEEVEGARMWEAVRKGVAGMCAQTSLSPKEAASFKTSFLPNPQSLYTHQFVTWANSAIRSSLLSCKIKSDQGFTGTKGAYPHNVPTGPHPPSAGCHPTPQTLKEMESGVGVGRARGES